MDVGRRYGVAAVSPTRLANLVGFQAGFVRIHQGERGLWRGMGGEIQSLGDAGVALVAPAYQS